MKDPECIIDGCQQTATEDLEHISGNWVCKNHQDTEQTKKVVREIERPNTA